MDPIFPSEFDISKISYGTPRTLDSGAKHIRVSYRRNNALIVQTPDMLAPFGINKWENPGAPAKHSLELSFKDVEDREELSDFKKMLASLDAKIVDDAFTGSLPTHSKKFASRDVLEVLYQPMIKLPKDDRFPPNFKVTLPVIRDEFNFPTYIVDSKGRPQLGDLSAIDTKGAICTVIMQCNGVWVAGGSNFGCTWKVTQLRIKPTSSNTAYAFKHNGGLIRTSDEDEEDEEDAGSDGRDNQDTDRE